jgi:hypothetical protein
MAGRPTSYDPKYCEMLIEHMATGMSFEAFAGLIEVSNKTLYSWAEANPDFLHAKEIAFEKSRLFWEKASVEHLINQYQGPTLNNTNWVFNMKNRFPKEWRDRQEIEHSGDAAKPLVVAYPKPTKEDD